MAIPGILHSNIEHVYMYKQASASGHGQLCTFTCSCMAIIITGKNTMTRSRSVRHIIKHIQIQDFFFTAMQIFQIDTFLISMHYYMYIVHVYIYTYKYSLDVFGYIKGVYIYVYNYIYMIVY